MLKNFQRYFRFYLASLLCGLLLAGIRWQAAPLGEMQGAEQPRPAKNQSNKATKAASGTLAAR
jgi:hypothetical protein